MATRTASRHVLEQQATRRTIARQRVSRRRRSLAGTLEMTLQPRDAVRRGLRNWPRIPHDNGDAAAAPVREIISLLRNPSVSIPDDVLRRVTALTTHPASPLYGQYSTQARYAAFALASDLRARALAHAEIGAAT
jgi:hypothetical protein